jgi:hypothetical protein
MMVINPSIVNLIDITVSRCVLKNSRYNVGLGFFMRGKATRVHLSEATQNTVISARVECVRADKNEAYNAHSLLSRSATSNSDSETHSSFSAFASLYVVNNIINIVKNTVAYLHIYTIEPRRLCCRSGCCCLHTLSSLLLPLLFLLVMVVVGGRLFMQTLNQAGFSRIQSFISISTSLRESSQSTTWCQPGDLGDE